MIELCDINTCTQCKACVQICPKHCITMVDASDGFKLPSIDRNICIKCGLCMRSCHKITPNLNFNIPIANFACWTKSISDRKKSSSGGAFSVLARHILSQGGVVFGASMSSDLKVRHIAISDECELAKIQGSKYVQSDIGNTYSEARDLLHNGQTVLYSGTPCQIAGLKTFLRKPYDNLYTCDIICHGVPSQKAFDIYLNKIKAASNFSDFKFRFTEGWGFQLSGLLEAPSLDGASIKKIISPMKSYYLRAFTKGLMFDESCYTCPYACTERISDITLGDYWGIGELKPFNHSTKHGVSCMLINTERGLTLCNNCNGFEYEIRPLEEAVKGNHNLSHTSERPKGRNTYFIDAINMSIKQLSKKYGISATWRDYLRIIKQVLNTNR